MALNFNVQPFFDDYIPEDKYYRILFRAGYAVQARELTQLQTILQQQIKRHGDHIFVNGAMVIPGQLSYSVNTSYVKLKSVQLNGSNTSAALSSTSNENPIGQKYIGSTSGVEAIVLQTSVITSTDANTLFVKYTRASDTDSTFTSGETLIRADGTSFTLSVEDSTTDANFIGTGSTASIEAGVYYIKDNFVLVEAQSIVLSKYTTTPTVKVGLQVNESVVYPETDENLLDNALGTYNFAAPGAARYSIELVLTTVSYIQTVDTTTFIPLLTLLDGKLQYILDKTIYNEIDKMLARRTYDESGDYTINDFPIKLQDYRNNFRGAWANSTSYIVGDIVVNDTGYYTCIAAYSSPASPTAFATASNWLLDNSPSYNFGLNDGVKLLSGRLGTPNIPIVSYTGTPETDIIPDTLKISLGVEPSKAYVKGFEIEKAVTEYLTLDKARTVSGTETLSLNTSPGNYILVNTLNYLPDIDTIVSFYDQYATAGTISSGTLIATARIKQIQYDSASVYKLFLFDVLIVSGKDFARQAKYLYSVTGSTTATRFSARIVPANNILPGLLAASSTSATVTGVNTTFSTVNTPGYLIVGDYVTIGTAGPYRVTTVTNNTTIVIDTAITIAVGTSIYRIEADLYLPALTNSFYTIPRYAVASTSGLQYTFYRRASAIVSPATVTATGYVFPPFSNTNYIAVKSDGTIGTITLTGDGTSQIVVTLSGGGTFDLVYAVRKTTGATPIVKTITNLTDTVTVSSTTSLAALTKPDAFEIQTVTKGTIDITSKFTLDNGQRDTHYDLASVTLKPSQYLIDVTPSSFVGTASITVTINTAVAHNLTTADVIVISGATGTEQTKLNGTWPVTVTSSTAFTVTVSSSVASGTLITGLGTAKITGGTITVNYSYFLRGTGDYCTIDSYSSLYYNQLDRTLINSIDFRPTKTSAGFTTPVVPAFGILTDLSYTYYLGRTDKLSLDSAGNYIVTKGVPAVTPVEPVSPNNSMDLYKFYIEPYTFNANNASVISEKVENKRYTMRDIGALETRVKNLEYYTALSELEQNTLGVKSYDAYGLERPQNGFIVDSFTGQGIGDVTSPDWIASIDITKKELRPFFTQQQVSLVESTNALLDRSGLNYTVNGDLVTLKITSTTPLVKQLRASHAESVNPFDSYSFIGDVELTPWSDNWFETNRRPDVIVNDNKQYDAVVNQAAASGVLGTVWNSWQQIWSGQSVVNSTGRLFTVEATGQVVRGSELGVITANTITGRTTGTVSRIESTTTTKTINDKLVSVDMIPFMRARGVMFKGAAFKPNTKIYAFFDKVPVDTYITYAKRITVVTAGAAKGTTVPTFKTDTNFGSNINIAARREVSLPYFRVGYSGLASDFGFKDNSNSSPTLDNVYLFVPLCEPKSISGQGWLPGSKVIVKQTLLAGTPYYGPGIGSVLAVGPGVIDTYGEFIFVHPMHDGVDGIRVRQEWFIGADNPFGLIQHVPSTIAPIGAVYNSANTLLGAFGPIDSSGVITSGLGSPTTRAAAGSVIYPGNWTATYLDGTVKSFTDASYSYKYSTPTVTINTGAATVAINATTGAVTISTITTAGTMTITWAFLAVPLYTRSITLSFA